MSIIAWIVLGLIAGFIASKIVGGQGQGFFLDIALGIVGALVGGFVATNIFGWEGITGFNFTSVFLAIGGSVIVLVIYHAVTGRRTV
jgi:uncharacterized membrane protein YeaQ/YmgE (transglycosylase-associated protein family)